MRKDVWKIQEPLAQPVIIEASPIVFFARGRGTSGGGGRSTTGGTRTRKGKSKAGTMPKSTSRRGSSQSASARPGAAGRRSSSANGSRRTGRSGAERTGM